MFRKLNTIYDKICIVLLRFIVSVYQIFIIGIDIGYATVFILWNEYSINYGISDK